MANLAMLWNNLSDAATLSGGNWIAGLPLTNMQNKLISKVARSTNDLTASTQFVVDLNSATALFSAVALVNHNFSSVAKVRISTSTVSNFASVNYQSDWLDVYAPFYSTPELSWSSANFWTGRVSDSDLVGYIRSFFYKIPTTQRCRYLKIEIDDTTNIANYLQIGRLMVGPLFQMAVNYDWGAGLGWLDSSVVSKSLGNTPFFDQRPKQRVFTCDANYLPSLQALAEVFEIQRRLGVTGEVFVAPDLDDIQHGFRRNMLGRFTNLTPLSLQSAVYYKSAFEIEEIL